MTSQEASEDAERLNLKLPEGLSNFLRDPREMLNVAEETK